MSILCNPKSKIRIPQSKEHPYYIINPDSNKQNSNNPPEPELK